MSDAKPSGSSQAVLDTLAWGRKEGFKPVPLLPQSKASLTNEYAQPGYKPPDDALWRSRNLGIGFVTGPKEGGPIDVDLDCAEAVHAARLFLVPTVGIFGRKSKPESHYVYRLTESEKEFIKFAILDPIEGKTIVELRGDNHQTVFPGSLHQDTGELVQWSKLPFPALVTVNTAQLLTPVKKIGAFTLIARHMWKPGQRNEMAKHIPGMFAHWGWDQESVETLLEGVMDYTGDKDQDRTRALIKATFAKFDKGERVTGAPTLKKILGEDRLVNLMAAWFGSPHQSIIEEYNERYGIANIEGQMKIATLTKNSKKHRVYAFMAREDFTFDRLPDTIQIDDKTVPKSRIWLSDKNRRTYDYIAFDPSNSLDESALNLWTGFHVAPSQGACEQWLKLLREVVCYNDEILSNWILDWFADIVQDPADRPGTALVIIGLPGAGKTSLVKYFAPILGPAFMSISNSEHISGRFNWHLSQTVLLQSEEAIFAGNKADRAILKSLITDDSFTAEKKHLSAVQMKNYVRLVLTSNEKRAAPVEANDRRYTVIDMKDRKITDEHKAAFFFEMKKGGPAALMQMLATRKYDKDRLRVNFITADHAAMQAANYEPIEDWWANCLRNGSVLSDELVKVFQIGENWPEWLGSSAAYQTASDYMRGKPNGSISHKRFAQEIERLTGMALEKKQISFDTSLGPSPAVFKLPSRQWAFKLQNLAKCREEFKRAIGAAFMDWPDDGEPFQSLAPDSKF